MVSHSESCISHDPLSLKVEADKLEKSDKYAEYWPTIRGLISIT